METAKKYIKKIGNQETFNLIDYINDKLASFSPCEPEELPAKYLVFMGIICSSTYASSINMLGLSPENFYRLAKNDMSKLFAIIEVGCSAESVSQLRDIISKNKNIDFAI